MLDIPLTTLNAHVRKRMSSVKFFPAVVLHLFLKFKFPSKTMMEGRYRSVRISFNKEFRQTYIINKSLMYAYTQKRSCHMMDAEHNTSINELL